MREMARLLGFKGDLAASDADALTLVLTLTHGSPSYVPVEP